VTKAIKRSDKLLVDSGDFLRAVRKTIDAGKKEALVGILDERGPHGQDLELIALVLEGGAYVRVTEKLRGWMAAQGFPLRKTTMYIRVPPRPVMGVAADEVEDEFGELVDMAVDAAVDQLF
jgi:hypothetical protein